MDEKLKALTNDIMKQCQEQGLTCGEVKVVMALISKRADTIMTVAVKKQKFKVVPY